MSESADTILLCFLLLEVDPWASLLKKIIVSFQNISAVAPAGRLEQNEQSHQLQKEKQILDCAPGSLNL